MPTDGTNLNVREEALAEDDIFQLSTNCLNHLQKSFNIHVNDGCSTVVLLVDGLDGIG